MFLNPKTLAMMQSAANSRSTLRSGKTGHRLLDDAENNVGNATILNPQELPAGIEFTVQKQTNPPRLLNLTADTNTGQSITVVMTASRQNNATGVAGPVTGIIEFGNGTQATRVEFDIPVGPYIGSFSNVLPGTEPEDSGAVIQVPTGIIRAYARYDNAYITPELGGWAFGGPGSPEFPLASGPFAPGLARPAPVRVKAFANYFGRIHSKLYKTHYVFIGNNGQPQTFSGTYEVPPFAKSVQLVPFPNNPTASLILELTDIIAAGSTSPQIISERYVIASNTYPIIPIRGNVNTIIVNSASAGAADKVTALKIVYEIGF